jgi:hypothetical protein
MEGNRDMSTSKPEREGGSRLRGSSVLFGTVTGSDGKPVEGAAVTIALSETPDKALATTKTDEKGRYRFQGPSQAKPYTLTVEAPDGRRHTSSVALRTKEHQEDITLPAQGGTDMPDSTDDAPTNPSNPQAGQPAAGGQPAGGAPAAEPAPAEGGGVAAPAAPANGNGNGNGAAADPFGRLLDLIETPDFAPEPAVNIGEANELARLFVISMYQLARVPEAINRLFTTRGANYQVGDLTLERMDQLSADVQTRMQEVIRSRTEQFDTEEDLLREIRGAFNLGTGTVPSVNAEFGPLYRSLVTTAADDRSGVDPEKVEKEDPAEAAAIFNFLRDLKRAILRLTQNASVYGTGGTKRLVDKWSEIMVNSISILDEVGRNHVVSADNDDKAPWSLLAALTDTPRGTVKAYVVNARDGGQMLRLAVGIYDAIQSSERGGDGLAAGGIDDEAREFLRRLFFSKGNAVLNPPLDAKVGDTLVVDELSKHARLVRDYVAPLWP